MSEDPTHQVSTRGRRLTVGICGRFRLYRLCLAETLRTEPDLSVVAAKRTAAGLAGALAGSPPDALVVLISDAGEADADLEEARRWFPNPLIVAVGPTSESRLNAAEGGFFIFLGSESGVPEIVSELRAAFQQGTSVATLLPRSGRSGGELSDRELGVLGLVARGLTSKQIAGQLGMTTKAVSSVKSRAYAKLGVSSQAQAVAVAVRNGIM